MSKKLSVVIVEYQSMKYLKKCIHSLEKYLKEIKYEIIVVSNSLYSSSQREKILSEFSNLKWIFNKRNVGYAKGVNIGIEHSVGEYLLILNPDTILLDENISKAIHYLESNQEVGLLGLRIVNSNGELEESFRSFMTPKILIERIFKRIVNKKINYNKNINYPLEVDWVSGACMLTSREKIKIIGLMDERYFMYVEDMDWCRRFWEKGYKVVYWPFSTVMHKASRRSSNDFLKKRFSKYVFIHILSYVKYIIKYFPKSLYK